MFPEPLRASRKWLLCATVVLATAAGCGRDSRIPLVVYSPHGRDLLRLVEAEFETAHPDVDVRALDMGSQEALDRVRSERSNPQSDVWFGGPSSLFARGAADSLLEPYRPDWADAIPGRAHGPDEMYHSAYETPAIIAYNTNAISADSAPTDWDQVLDPEWRGNVLIRNPIASGTMRAIFGMIILRGINSTGDTAAGFDWLRRLDTQTRDYPLNPALLHQQLTREEGTVTLWDMPDILIMQDRGAPFGYTLPTSGAPVIEDAIAIVRGTRHVDAARRFVDWVGSTHAQILAARDLFRLPARTDLPADSLPQWVKDVRANLVVEDMDWERVANEGPQWMTYWDRHVRGRG